MWAALGWDAEHEGGRWLLRIVSAVGDDVAMSSVGVEWSATMSGPPSLLDRYDALAELGFEVVHGGAEAWAWAEGMTASGCPLLAGHTEVRPVVRVAELSE